jgi:hypothetical protein
MDDLKTERDGYECVDPDVGEEMWRLGAPALDAALRRRLETHLTVCDACRLRRAVERRVAEGLSDGTLSLPARRRGPRAARAVAWGGALAAAAGLALMMILPPRARDGDRLVRGPGDPQFRRPVEGEVVRGGRPTLSWAAIEGATAYRIVVDEVGGDHAWRGETAGLSIDVPAAVELPASRDYRAFLEPVPADLAQPGGVSVSFRTGDTLEFLVYRLAASPWVARAFVLAGLLGLGAGFLLGFRRT